LNLQLQNFYETARENSMRERLLTMIGAQREVLLQRRSELQYLQQAAAELAGAALPQAESMPMPRSSSTRSAQFRSAIPEQRQQRELPNLILLNRRNLMESDSISSRWSAAEAINLTTPPQLGEQLGNSNAEAWAQYMQWRPQDADF